MARLRRRSSDSFILIDGGDDDLPHRTAQAARTSPRKQAAKTKYEVPEAVQHVKKPKSTSNHSEQQRRQVRLAPLNQLKSASAGLQFKLPAEFQCEVPPKKSVSPRKAKVEKPEAIAPPVLLEEVDIDETIGCGDGSATSDSDFELPSPREFLKHKHFPQSKTTTQTNTVEIDSSDEDDIVQHKKPIRSTSRPGSSSDKENQRDAILRFSPPRNHNPLVVRPRTPPPPPSPTKGKLLSPSKRAPKIPTPPLRPSLDAFWDVNTINEWNDQYSPRKEWKSPKKIRSSSSDSTPTGSPRKQAPTSPTKRTKVEIEAKRTWDLSKDGIARSFLVELDKIITGNQVSKLAENTGGVTITWSKTLNSTAGRANWRRETIKKRQPDGTCEITQTKHFASIELAEKVIDDEDRLLNVLAHEFCHLCNFMISNIRDQPHGKQFKIWGAKVTRAFAHRGIKVTTKHSYEIEYKYIWSCNDCEQEYKRHSKSIDPARHSCGKCRGKLTQIKPIPRNVDSGYTKFVKDNFKKIKDQLGPGKTQGEIMEAVARHYRETKATTNKTVDDVVRKLAFVSLD